MSDFDHPLALDEADPDWIKRGAWDLPTIVHELRAHLAAIEMSVEEFRQTEAYRSHVEAMPWLREL